MLSATTISVDNSTLDKKVSVIHCHSCADTKVTRQDSKKKWERRKKFVADLVGRQNCHADLAATAGRNPGGWKG